MKINNLITKRNKKGIPLKGFILEVINGTPVMIAFEEECVDIYFFNKEKEMFGIVIDLKELVSLEESEILEFKGLYRRAK